MTLPSSDPAATVNVEPFGAAQKAFAHLTRPLMNEAALEPPTRRFSSFQEAKVDDLYVYGRDTLKARSHFGQQQHGVCAICRRPEYSLVVDHEHSEMGLVRGLLCTPCNTGLGFFSDDPARFAAAIDYLKQHEVRNVVYADTDDWEERRPKASIVPLDAKARAGRDKRIRKASHAGESTAALAHRFNLTVSTVNKIIAA